MRKNKQKLLIVVLLLLLVAGGAMIVVVGGSDNDDDDASASLLSDEVQKNLSATDQKKQQQPAKTDAPEDLPEDDSVGETITSDQESSTAVTDESNFKPSTSVAQLDAPAEVSAPVYRIVAKSPQGAPISEAPVVVTFGPIETAGRTNANGIYEARLPASYPGGDSNAPQSATFEIRAPGYAPQSIDVPLNELAEVTLEQLTFVHGKVKGDHGNAQRVFLFRYDYGRAAPDDSVNLALSYVRDGRYTLANLMKSDGSAPKKGERHYEGPAVVAAIVLGEVVLSEPFDLREGKWHEVDVEVLFKGTIRGQVRGLDDIAAIGLSVTLTPSDSLFDRVTTLVSEENSFAFESLKAGSYRLQFEASSTEEGVYLFVPDKEVTLLNDNDQVNADLDLSATAVVEILVRINDQRPVSGNLFTENQGYHLELGRHESVKVFGLAPGSYRVAFRPRRDTPVGTINDTLDVTTVGETLRFEKNYSNPKITGRVIWPGSISDEAKTKARVTVISARQEGQPRATPNTEGEYEILGLSPGSVTLIAQAPGYVSPPLVVELSADSVVDLQLAPAASLTLAFLSEQSTQELKGQRFVGTLRSDALEGGVLYFKADADAEGRLLISDALPAGTYTLRFSDLPKQIRIPFAMSIEVLATEAKVVEVPFDQAAVVKVFIKGVNQQTAFRFWIALTDEEGKRLEIGPSTWNASSIEAEGAWAELPNVPAGTHKLIVTHDDYQRIERDVEIPAEGGIFEIRITAEKR